MRHETLIPCLLCGARPKPVEPGLSAKEIIDLWAACGKNIQAVVCEEMADRTAMLLECSSCGFRYFDPSLTGTGRFYDAVQDPNYYVASKPEYNAACEIIKSFGKQNPKVLDVGCGMGAFLDLASIAGAETFGIEISEKAARETLRRGHKTFSCLLDELPQELGSFDMITLFQVLEHVADPVELAKTAAGRLASGGILFVAVPNNRGVVGLSPFSPYQWPPHHISRWDRKDVAQLGNLSGLELLHIGHDPMTTSELRHYWSLRNLTHRAIGRSGSQSLFRVIKALTYCLKLLGTNKLKLPYGHSIWAVMRKK